MIQVLGLVYTFILEAIQMGTNPMLDPYQFLLAFILNRIKISTRLRWEL